jgi:hypothetical protein
MIIAIRTITVTHGGQLRNGEHLRELWWHSAEDLYLLRKDFLFDHMW